MTGACAGAGIRRHETLMAPKVLMMADFGQNDWCHDWCRNPAPENVDGAESANESQLRRK
jgi:hypothetical protein